MPICLAMVICENVLAERDDVMSAIRIVDTLTVPPRQPGQPNIGDICCFGRLQLLTILKNGDATGEFQCQFVCRDPTQKTTPVAVADVVVDGGPEGGQNMAGPALVRWAGEGLYWIELMIGDTLIAKTPLKIKLEEAKPSS